jgi:hypothetical protein
MVAGFNWRRGLGPSLALIAATVGYAAWIGRANSGHQAIRFWAIVAVFVLGEVVLALATSYLAQTGREGLSRFIRGGVTIAFLGGAFWFGDRVSGTVFTNEERAPFVAVDRNGERRLLHPALGFSILHPGPGFVPSASQAYRANAHFYVFTDQAGGEALTVGLFKGFGGSSASLRDLIEEDGARGRATACGASRDHRRRPAPPHERLRLEASGAGADSGTHRRHVVRSGCPFGRAGELPAVAHGIKW